MVSTDKVIERLEYCAETRDGYVRDSVNDAIELIKNLEAQLQHVGDDPIWEDNMITTVTIWEKGDMDPCTVAFSSRKDAEAYKKKMEKILQTGGNTDYRVSLDSGELNDGKYYLEEFAREMGVDVPSEQEADPDTTEVYITYAVSGRYHTSVRVPKNEIPERGAPESVREAFARKVMEESEGNYYDADFGSLEDIDGHATIVEDMSCDIIWDRA